MGRLMNVGFMRNLQNRTNGKQQIATRNPSGWRARFACAPNENIKREARAKRWCVFRATDLILRIAMAQIARGVQAAHLFPSAGPSELNAAPPKQLRFSMFS